MAIQLQKTSNLVEELPSREIIESPAITCADKQLSSTEEIIICDKPRPETPITLSVLPDENEILAVDICDHSEERVEPATHIPICEAAMLPAVAQAEITSLETICMRKDLLPETLKCEDGGVDFNPGSVAESIVTLDRDNAKDVIDERDHDSDTRSLAAFSIFSSTLTPISSPLTSPVDSAFDPDFHFEKLDSPRDSVALIARSRCSSSLPDEDKNDASIRTQSVSRATEKSRVPTSRQSRSPVPGSSTSSSNVKSRTSPSPIGEDSHTRSRGNTPAKDYRQDYKNGVSDDARALETLEATRGVKPKRSKPKMLDTRREDKEQMKGSGVKANPKVTEDNSGSRDGESVSVGKSKSMGERKGRKKRLREEGEVANRSRLSSPSYSSDAAPPKPKKIKKRKTEDSTTVIMGEDMRVTASRASASARSSRVSSACPSDLDEAVDTLHASSGRDANEDPDKDAKDEVCGLLIQSMALARASSMPASSLIRELLRENPHLNGRRSHDAWLDLINTVLRSHVVFGRIDRQGLDAADKPLEPQWYYIPEKDWDVERATLLKEMMPKKRNETKKHKQYYYRPVSKITRWDPEDDI